MSKPVVRPEPVLIPTRDDPNAPDNVATHHYGTVMFDWGALALLPEVTEGFALPTQIRATRATSVGTA